MIGPPVPVDLAMMQPWSPPVVTGATAMMPPELFSLLPVFVSGPTAAAPGMFEEDDSWWSGTGYGVTH